MRRILFAVLLSLALVGCEHLKSDDDDDSNGGTGGEVVAPAATTPQSADGKTETQPATTTQAATPAATPEPAPAPAPAPAAVTKSNQFDHYNPAAWHGRGSAIVLCSGFPVMDSCEIEGRGLSLHGSRDKGRLVYTSYSKKGLSGTVVCKRGSQTWAFEVRSRGVQYGSCR